MLSVLSAFRHSQSFWLAAPPAKHCRHTGRNDVRGFRYQRGTVIQPQTGSIVIHRDTFRDFSDNPDIR